MNWLERKLPVTRVMEIKNKFIYGWDNIKFRCPQGAGRLGGEVESFLCYHRWSTCHGIIYSFSLGPVHEFVCISFRTGNLNCFRIK